MYLNLTDGSAMKGIGSERKQCAVLKTITDDNLSVELTQFSFALSGGGGQEEHLLVVEVVKRSTS